MPTRQLIDASAFGQFLKEKRTEAGYTQLQVADRFGYSTTQFISNIERGTILPPVQMFFEFVDIYKVPDTEVIEFLIRSQKKRLDRSSHN